jgi:D-beta-D-heptose 7-phosphate kinase/D-beta-D-heptose 1-phosphate adenosyltransferase
MLAKKINLKECLKVVKNLKRLKKKVVMTNGCFYIVHSGHVDYLHKTKKLGDILIVAINSDASIKNLKGKHRPINDLSDRIKVLTSISFIDYIIPFSSNTPEKLYKLIKPGIITKGGDYKKSNIAGSKHVIENGGKLKLIPLIKNKSTSKIINKIRKLKI